jgi:hypothetical protein
MLLPRFEFSDDFNRGLASDLPCEDFGVIMFLSKLLGNHWPKADFLVAGLLGTAFDFGNDSVARGLDNGGAGVVDTGSSVGGTVLIRSSCIRPWFFEYADCVGSSGWSTTAGGFDG